MRFDEKAIEVARKKKKQQAHADELASLSPSLRRVEEFKAACAARAIQLMGNKDNPNTAFHQKGRELIKAAIEGNDWTPEEKRAAADAVEEWLPKILKIDIKEERKKLKLSALRTS